MVLVDNINGFSVFLSNKHKSKSWLHVDQNPSFGLLSLFTGTPTFL
jgi:hypothetical protein